MKSNLQNLLHLPGLVYKKTASYYNTNHSVKDQHWNYHYCYAYNHLIIY